MARVRILITPNHMKIAATKVAQHLKIMDYDTIFFKLFKGFGGECRSPC